MELEIEINEWFLRAAVGPVRIVGGAAHTEPTANVPTAAAAAAGHTFQLPAFIYYYIVNARAPVRCASAANAAVGFTTVGYYYPTIVIYCV